MDSLALNGVYHPSYFLNGMFAEYTALGLTKIIDGDLAIPESRYTAEIFPWVKKLSRFIIGEYNENYVDRDSFIASIRSVGQEFQIHVLTDDEARAWISENTDLVEDENGFKISDEVEDPILGIIPARYLKI
jgi:hypothetical protein